MIQYFTTNNVNTLEVIGMFSKPEQEPQTVEKIGKYGQYENNATELQPH